MSKVNMPIVASSFNEPRPELGGDPMAPKLEKMLGLNRQLLTPEQVLRLAVDKARDRASDLISAVQILNSLGGDDNGPVEIERDTLAWLGRKLAGDAGEIMTDLDYALNAMSGKVYDGSDDRFGEFGA